MPNAVAKFCPSSVAQRIVVRRDETCRVVHVVTDGASPGALRATDLTYVPGASPAWHHLPEFVTALGRYASVDDRRPPACAHHPLKEHMPEEEYLSRLGQFRSGLR